MSTLADLLTQGRERRVYSGAAWSVGTADGPLDRGWTGTRSWGGNGLDDAPLDGAALWDLASVTKPIVGLAVLALIDEARSPSPTPWAATARNTAAAPPLT